MSTYRERRLAKAERLRGWADKRDAKSASARKTVDHILDVIPNGQPILVGHHSEKRHRRDLDRLDSAFGNMVEHAKTADSFRSRADGIEAAADRAIYDDDPDAIERLEEKLAGLEAKRAEYTAYNKTHVAVKKPGVRYGDEPIGKILEKFKRAGKTFVRVEYRDKTTEEVAVAETKVALPSYMLSNLGGTITTTRKRLELLKARQQNDATRETRTVGDATIAPGLQSWIVEVSFPERPASEILDELRTAGFRWVGARQCWIGSKDHLPDRYNEEL